MVAPAHHTAVVIDTINVVLAAQCGGIGQGWHDGFRQAVAVHAMHLIASDTFIENAQIAVTQHHLLRTGDEFRDRPVAVLGFVPAVQLRVVHHAECIVAGDQVGHIFQRAETGRVAAPALEGVGLRHDAGGVVGAGGFENVIFGMEYGSYFGADERAVVPRRLGWALERKTVRHCGRGGHGVVVDLAGK